MEGDHLAGVCGLYCGACTLYRVRHDRDRKDADSVIKEIAERLNVPAEELYCEGCLSDGPHSPFCAECEIRRCALTTSGVIRCYDCSKFPCGLIVKFNNDGVPQHSQTIKNIRRQHQIGVYEWCQEEYERIRCQFCGVSLDWDAQTCHRCGTKAPTTITGFIKGKPSKYTHYRA